MTTPPPLSIIRGGSISTRPSAHDCVALYSAAVAVTIGSAIAFAATYLVRGGLDGTAIQIAGIFVLSVFPIWASAIAIERFSKTTIQFAFATLIAILASTLLPVAGLYAGGYTVLVASALGLFALFDGKKHLQQAFNGTKLTITICAAAFCVFLIVFTETVRFFLPETLLLGMAIPDRYYHISIAQMIAQYGHVSLGADGLLYRPYHFLSHLIAAGLAKSSGADVPLIYLYWGAFTLKIQLIWSTFISGMFFVRTRESVASATISRLAYATLLVIAVGMLESESFLLGTTLFFAVLPLLVLLASEKYSDTITYPALSAVIVGSVVVTIAKVSAGFFCVIGLVAVLWHLRRNRAVVTIIPLSCILIAFIAVKWIAEQDLATTHSPFLMFWVDYLHYFTWTTFFSYLIPLVSLVLMVRHIHVGIERRNGLLLSLSTAGPAHPATSSTSRRSDAFHAIRRFSHEDGIVHIFALSILGSILVLLTTPIGANNAFFSLMLLNLSFCFVPRTLCYSWRSVLPQKSVAAILGTVVALCIFWQTAAFVFTETTGMPYTLVALYRAALPHYKAASVKDSIITSMHTTRKPFSNLQSLIDASPIAQLKADLDRQADAVGGHIVVHIPPEADEVWHELSLTTWWCMTGHLVVPAVAGIAEIRSIPPKAVEDQCVAPGVLAGYGFGSKQDAHRTTDFTPDQLCMLARPLGARRVYRLVSYKDLSKNRVINCP